MTRIAILQMNSGIDPEANCKAIADKLAEAALGGAVMLFTPEMSSLLDRDRKRAAPHIVREEASPVLSALQSACKTHGLWLALGSMPVAGQDEKSANRSIVIDDEGNIQARYDKMHMFDVDLDSGESWRESNAYQAGNEAVAIDSPVGKIGLTVCYDLRFPALFDELGRRECGMIAVPAAFTVPTGEAHWHVLLRARAIEASAFVIAAAQVGKHEDGRQTYGHSLVVDPWGEVLLDMGGDQPGLAFVDIDLERIAEVRAQIPSLANRRDIPRSASQ
jgi:predicted amidohydrolase